MSNQSSVVLAHLDACEQCRLRVELLARGLRPIDACPIGSTLLRLGVDGRLGAVEHADTEEHERGYGHGV